MSSPERTYQTSRVSVQYLVLVIATALALPVSILALFYNYAALVLIPQNTLRRHVRKSTRFRPQKIIITGIDTPAGLRLARAFHHTGHDVVGIAEGGSPVLNHARWSNSICRFYTIRTSDTSGGISAYAQDLLRVVMKERAKMWINCSRTTSIRVLVEAKQKLESRTACLSFIPSADQATHFESRHVFLSYAQGMGLPTPETHSVRSRHDIHNVLNDSKGKRYLLSSPNGTSGSTMCTILPRRTVSQTYQDVARLKFSSTKAWTLAEYMDDLPRYTTCAVIVHGEVKAFAASCSLDADDCKAVPPTSGLSQAMQQYVQDFAQLVKPALSTDLIVEFCLDERATSTGVVQQILPVGARLGSHETVLLFNGKKGSVDLTRAYMAALSSASNGLGSYTGLPHSDSPGEVLLPNQPDGGVYYLFQDSQTLIMAPLLKLAKLQVGVLSVVREFMTFTNHLLCRQEALYEFGDPLPLFWYVYVSVPVQLLLEFVRSVWSRTRLRGRKAVEQNGG